MTRLPLVVLLGLVFLSTPNPNLRANVFDREVAFWGEHAKLLKVVVRKVHLKAIYGEFYHTVVDYGVVLEGSEPKQKKFVLQLIEDQANKLKNAEAVRVVRDDDEVQPHQALAFWMNAYNFFTLKDVLEVYPIKSMQSIGWKRRVHEVAGKAYSLDDIEHNILRPMGEPLIHFGINCAAVSCPPLVGFAFNSKTALAAIDYGPVRNAMKNPLFVRVDAKGNLHYSAIFEWFAEDFKGIDRFSTVDSNGKPDYTTFKEPFKDHLGNIRVKKKVYKDFTDFVRRYQPKNFPTFKKAKKVIPYDWSLNTYDNLVKHLKVLRKKNPELRIEWNDEQTPSPF